MKRLKKRSSISSQLEKIRKEEYIQNHTTAFKVKGKVFWNILELYDTNL